MPNGEDAYVESLLRKELIEERNKWRDRYVKLYEYEFGYYQAGDIEEFKNWRKEAGGDGSHKDTAV